MGREHHGTNCAYRADPDEPCTCGVTERTEREMHAAWRKRAEEAEAAIAAMTAERDARDVAIGVLAEICRNIADNNPDHDRDFLTWKVSNIANPLARAAVER